MASYPNNTSVARTLMSKYGILGIVIGLIVLIAIPIMIGQTWTNLDAHEIMVVQSPMSGNLSCYTDPGLKMTSFGRVTKYPRRAEYDFNLSKEGNKVIADNTKKIQFSDGGHANLDGAVNWEMPLDCPSVIGIHRAFGSADGITTQGIAKAIDSAIYLSGPMMTSTEASGERKAELVELINDQASNGIYQTSSHREEQPDPITGEKKMVTIVQVARDVSGKALRQQSSILAQFSIKLLPISLKDIIYDDVVGKQIARRQEANTEVQISQANARKAEQDAITTAKQGEASAAKAKWEQETINAKEIAEAEKNKRVAELSALTAAQYKQQQILKGEGEAEYKRLIINADGALQQKLAAYVEVQRAYASAVGAYQGNWVPQTVFGGGSGSGSNGASALVDLLTAKTARDLNLDLSVSKKGSTGDGSK